MVFGKGIHRFYLCPLCITGPGAVSQIGEYINRMGKHKALLVSDKKLVDLGITKRIETLISEAGCSTVVYDNITSEPTLTNVYEGVDLGLKESVDLVVSIGGGSAHDCAKAIALVLSNGGDVKEYEGLDISKKPAVTIIAVNTTAGTGSEITRFSIITDVEAKRKFVIADSNIIPSFAINDPELMLELPPLLTATTGVDALTHAIEAFTSTDADPITDACALQSIMLVGKYLHRAVANGHDLEARDAMCYAQLLGEMAANSAGLGYAHAMAQALGSLYGVPHGLANALVLPMVMEFNVKECPERMARIADALGESVRSLEMEDAALRAPRKVKALLKTIGIPQNLSEAGIAAVDLKGLVEYASKEVCGLTNPRKADSDDLNALFCKLL